MNYEKFFFMVGVFVAIYFLEAAWPLYQEQQKRWLHDGRNLAMFVINSALLFLFSASLNAWVFLQVEQRHWGIFNRVTLPDWLNIVAVVLLFDLWMYIWHRLNHRIPFFWRFHRMHHSDTAMNITTAVRFHVGEIFFSSVLRLGVVILLGMKFWELILYESLMMPVIMFHHSKFNLPAAADRILRMIIVTPWMHWVHHSDIPRETHSNFGTIFSWWDRLARTFRMRSDPKAIQFGLRNFREDYWQTVPGLLKTPFVKQKEVQRELLRTESPVQEQSQS